MDADETPGVDTKLYTLASDLLKTVLEPGMGATLRVIDSMCVEIVFRGVYADGDEYTVTTVVRKHSPKPETQSTSQSHHEPGDVRWATQDENPS